MRATTLLGGVLLVAGLGSGTVTASDHGMGHARQWALVYLAEPTLIGSTIVQGPGIARFEGELTKEVHRLPGNWREVTDQLVSDGFAFFSEATNAFVSEIPNRYFGETMKIFCRPSLPTRLPAAVPSMYVFGTMDT